MYDLRKICRVKYIKVPLGIIRWQRQWGSTPMLRHLKQLRHSRRRSWNDLRVVVWLCFARKWKWGAGLEVGAENGFYDRPSLPSHASPSIPIQSTSLSHPTQSDKSSISVLSFPEHRHKNCEKGLLEKKDHKPGSMRGRGRLAGYISYTCPCLGRLSGFDSLDLSELLF